MGTAYCVWQAGGVIFSNSGLCWARMTTALFKETNKQFCNNYPSQDLCFPLDFSLIWSLTQSLTLTLSICNSSKNHLNSKSIYHYLILISYKKKKKKKLGQVLDDHGNGLSILLIKLNRSLDISKMIVGNF